MENPEQHRSERYYRRHGMVTRPVHLTPDEAKTIRRAAFDAGVSQQVYMRLRLADVLTPSEVAQRLAAVAVGYEPAPPVKLTKTA